MRITFVTRTFGNVARNSHCDVIHITPVRVARLVLDCNGVFAIKAYCHLPEETDVQHLCAASYDIIMVQRPGYSPYKHRTNL